MPLALLVLPVAIAAAIVGVLVFVGGSKVVGVITGHTDETPPFTFKMGKTIAISTDEKHKPTDLQGAADQVAQAALPAIHTFFSEAYLNPGNWKDGSYDSAFEVFDSAARQNALGQLSTVTLGPDAGSTYESVAPGKSKVWFRVLFDQDGNASQVDAVVRFHALGKGKDGSYTDITAHGQFFLHDTGDGWKVYAFTIGRTDHPTTPPTGPSAGATPSPSA